MSKNFSLGRWAIGYQGAYVLYRVLDEIRPLRILELGLGQSTKLIAQYAEFYGKAEHTVIEADTGWIDFFKRNYRLGAGTQIRQCPYTFEDYSEYQHIRVFDGMERCISGKTYDLIVIDAPFGGDMKELSGIDVLKNIPECLGESFVIIFDDVNRNGENKTFSLMKKNLNANNIKCYSSIYRGQKMTGVIVSEHLKFVCSM